MEPNESEKDKINRRGGTKGIGNRHRDKQDTGIP